MGTITHIGKKDSGRRTARYKRLVNSGIFRDEETSSRLVDAQGAFENWTNQPARDWIEARVRELKAGRDIDLSCNCCTSRDQEFLERMEKIKLEKGEKGEWKRRGEINDNCHAAEIIKLIKQLAEKD